MQQVATKESVRLAMKKLEAERQRVTGRAVMSITGGSLGTILALIKEVRAEGYSGFEGGIEISDDLKLAMAQEIGAVARKVREQMAAEVAQARADAAEALESLMSAESQIRLLSEELEEMRMDLRRQQAEAEKAVALADEKIMAHSERIAELSADRRDLAVSLEAERNRAVTAEKAAAVAEQRADGLAQQLNRIGELETEKMLLIEAGERARSEALAARVQTEQAERGVQKAEGRIDYLTTSLEAERDRAVIAEKAAAVADQRLFDLRVIVDGLSAQKREAEERIVQLEKALAVAGKQATARKNKSAKSVGENVLPTSERD